jgi:polysaccharide pyruvyl transferase WcaK-like protein
MIAIIHAYSRRNAGDSLLIDLTLQRLELAGVPTDRCRVLALDADSFDDLPNVVAVPGEPWGRPSRAAVKAAGGAVATLTSLPPSVGGRGGVVRRALADVDGIVAVGGGYLRTGSVTNSLGSALNHLPQLLTASRAQVPTVYLPQSIGPLRGPVGRAIRSGLSRMSAVHVRDDRSATELGALGNIVRTPDLAVLEVAERETEATGGVAAPPILVGRALPRADDYEARLAALASALGEHRWAVQAEGLGDRGDGLFYRRLGVTSVGTLRQALEAEPAVVVSVRLHGALQALIAGRPAIHLSYERKGWGAYEDLGIAEFVHSARHFDPQEVVSQVRGIRDCPDAFWEPLRRRLPLLRERSRSLTEQVRDLLA